MEALSSADSAQMRALVNRLKRAQGQVGGVVRMIEQGRGCAEIVTQLSAAHRALDRAGYEVISLAMSQCLAASPGPSRTEDLEQLRRLFLSLA